MSERKASLERKTKETEIRMSLNLDGEGGARLDTQIPFFNHMLDHLVKYSRFDLDLMLRGDIEIDCHHSVEDTGLVLGSLMREAMGDRAGMSRFGHFTLPMDEVLVTAAVDLGGRYYFKINNPDLLSGGKFGIYDSELSAEFLQKMAMNAKMNLHIMIHYGENLHHIHEAIFKALGKALRMAVQIDPALKGDIQSTKGVLE